VNTPAATNSGDRTLAVLTPILGFFTSFVGPLIVYLVKNSEGDSAALRSARESLNFQITVALAIFLCVLTIWLILPLFLIWVIGVANFILCIVHAAKASGDQDFRYPFCLRLIKN
jgi:uncharacterized Tic20 family protein